MTRILRIGTRGSQLALWQAGETKRLLEAQGVASELVTIRTTGDKRPDVSLAAIGGKGLFIKELEEALDRGTIDLAVHSLKDVPSILPERFRLAAFLERADPRDAWLHAEDRRIDELAAGSVIGTSAPRRRAQLRELYPHLVAKEMRGNVDTRIAKMRAGHYDGAVLAAAGITRLGRAGEITSIFETDVMLPAAGQGIVAIETLASDVETHDLVRRINDTRSEVSARSERGVLQQFGELLDCYSAIAVHSVVDGERLSIRAYLSDLACTRSIRASRQGKTADAEGIVQAVAADLAAQGAIELLQERKHA
jgi:hydroxymethylbilane synthase